MTKTPSFCIWATQKLQDGKKFTSRFMPLTGTILIGENANDNRTCVNCDNFVEVVGTATRRERETWK